jgi:hypothetical protein
VTDHEEHIPDDYPVKPLRGLQLWYVPAEVLHDIWHIGYRRIHEPVRRCPSDPLHHYIINHIGQLEKEVPDRTWDVPRRSKPEVRERDIQVTPELRRTLEGRLRVELRPGEGMAVQVNRGRRWRSLGFVNARGQSIQKIPCVDGTEGHYLLVTRKEQTKFYQLKGKELKWIRSQLQDMWALKEKGVRYEL